MSNTHTHTDTLCLILYGVSKLLHPLHKLFVLKWDTLVLFLVNVHKNFFLHTFLIQCVYSHWSISYSKCIQSCQLQLKFRCILCIPWLLCKYENRMPICPVRVWTWYPSHHTACICNLSEMLAAQPYVKDIFVFLAYLFLLKPRSVPKAY